MPYCNNCGTQVSENAKFCENCGRPVNNQNYGQPQYDYQHPPYQPPQQEQYYPYMRPARPKTPGKGAGIASMVLGIIGLLYACICFVAMIEEGADSGVAPAVFIFSPISILAICFANGAVNNGYDGGISKSGMTTGIIGLIGYILSFFGSFA